VPSAFIQIVPGDASLFVTQALYIRRMRSFARGKSQCFGAPVSRAVDGDPAGKSPLRHCR